MTLFHYCHLKTECANIALEGAISRYLDMFLKSLRTIAVYYGTEIVSCLLLQQMEMDFNPSFKKLEFFFQISMLCLQNLPSNIMVSSPIALPSFLNWIFFLLPG